MLIDFQWLLLLPLGLIMAFAGWLMWDIAVEINAHKRRWVLSYRASESDDCER